MTDIFLKFPNQPTAIEVLHTLGMTYTDDDGDVHLLQGSHQYALWEVGQIIGVNGWHVNLRVIDANLDISNLLPYMLEPKNPVCVWA